MAFRISKVTDSPKHHFFGFHDLVQTNAKGDLALSLEVEDISHPPLPGESCVAGVVDLETGDFKKLHTTQTWNYPQGARQQWLGDSDLCLCNDRDSENRLVCRVSDARSGRLVETLPFPVHCLDARSRRAFGLNYDRIYACGGYGYKPGKSQICPKRVVDIPSDDGIFLSDLDAKDSRLLVSIADAAACGEPSVVRTGYPHYLTHLMLNPCGTRLCFLHRYRVPDGGEITRLMTIGTDGTGLRCLVKGFLSHFTWISDDEIFIWGRDESALCRMREMIWFRVPGILQAALFGKKCIRLFRAVRQVFEHMAIRCQGKASVKQDRSFIIVKDVDNPTSYKNGVGVLTEDGHPMACPTNLGKLVSDTYPDLEGIRQLMLYDVVAEKRIEIGRFKRVFVEPDPKSFDWKASQKGVDMRIQKKFLKRLYLFTRSGFHTDLHPRWSYDGTTVFFDSIHDGSRQIYVVKVQ